MTLYRGLTKQQLDVLYDNSSACENWPKLYAGMQENSKKFYATIKGARDVPYHTAKRTKFDFIDSGKDNAPTYIFIHGGYWTHCVKEDFAFIAEGITQAGINVILVEYTLAPEASMAQIVAEVGMCLDFLQSNAKPYKIDPKNKIVLSGHSAGGHLTCAHRNHPLITHAMPISALVDLYPISLTTMNDNIRLTDKQIEDHSPIRHVRDGVPTSVHNGADELLELIRHSLEYAEALLTTKSKSVYSQTPGCNHFTQLYEFRNPDGFLLKALQNLLKK